MCSLLDILAGRKDMSGMRGTVLVNGDRQPKNFKCIAGYVVQVQCMGMHTPCALISPFFANPANFCGLRLWGEPWCRRYCQSGAQNTTSKEYMWSFIIVLTT